MVLVRVPATAANLGPGFDSLGLALTLYNDFEFQLQENGINISGCAPEFCTDDNLAITSFLYCWRYLGKPETGLSVKISSSVPVGSGLGSSSTCVVAGVMAANILEGKPLSKRELVKIATEIEGHPDNVAPALLGKMVIAVQDEKDIFCNVLTVATGLRFVALTPDYSVSTEEARKRLPSEISFADAVFNVGRVGLLISSLVNGNFCNLHASFKDRLHEPYRCKLIKEWDELELFSEEAEADTFFISGSGPTVIFVFQDDGRDHFGRIQPVLAKHLPNWTARELRIDWQGARIMSSDT